MLNIGEDHHSTALVNLHCSRIAAVEEEHSGRKEIVGIAAGVVAGTAAEAVGIAAVELVDMAGILVDTAVLPHSSSDLGRLKAVVHKGLIAVGAKGQGQSLVADRDCHIVSVSLDKSLRLHVHLLELRGMHHR